MRRILQALALVTVCVIISACDQQSADFVLPEGDAENGQALFVSYGCNGCHTMSTVDLPEPDTSAEVRIPLGGRVSQVKSYPELVTSIINPSHKFYPRRRAEEVSEDGESLMQVYNDVMTITELTDLVAFLEAQYIEFERPGYRYRVYPGAD